MNKTIIFMNKTKIPRGWRIIPEGAIIKVGDRFEIKAWGWMQCGSSIGMTKQEGGFAPYTRIIRQTAKKKLTAGRK